MKTGATVAVAFRERAQPLAAAGLYAEGAARARLLEQLAAAPGERLAALRGVDAGDCVVLLGPESELPWVDGVVYLGRDPRAPLLLVPTCYEPDVPLELLEQRVAAAVQPAPIALVPHARRVIAVGHACVLEREALQVLCGEQGAAP
jgi:hypothetical protein